MSSVGAGGSVRLRYPTTKNPIITLIVAPISSGRNSLDIETVFWVFAVQPYLQP